MENKSITPVELFPPTKFQEFNINYKCRVKPTPTGMAIIWEERYNLQRRIPHMDWSKWMEPDSEGYLEMEMWRVMETFGGRHMHMSGNHPIGTSIMIENIAR
jgi:hypothetical protein